MLYAKPAHLKQRLRTETTLGAIPVHHTTSEIPAIGSQLEAVRVETQADPVLSQLKHQIFQGRSDARKNIPEIIYPVWNYQD